MRRLLTLVLPCLLALGPAPAEGDARRLARDLAKLVETGGVVVAHEGRALYAERADTPFVPASTLKLATALVALHHLGADYRFKTEVFLSPDGDLTLRGYGDPFLVSEEWELIARELEATGALPARLGNVYLDTSAFAPDVAIPGIDASLNPYDAANGALAANFNTVHVVVEPGGRVRSAETQTPLTPIARRFAATLRPGKQRVNLSRHPDAPPRYAGELAAELLRRRGVETTGRVALRRVGEEDRLILTHHNSRTLEQVIEAMMLYSNNFVANQLLLTVGLEVAGEPATLDKGVRALERYLSRELGLDAADFRVVEGSGISRHNLLKPAALAEIARAFYPHRGLLPAEDGVRLKTGTLTGVYTLVGYLPASRPLVFAIMLNQPKNRRMEVLSRLRREVAPTFEPMLRDGA